MSLEALRFVNHEEILLVIMYTSAVLQRQIWTLFFNHSSRLAPAHVSPLLFLSYPGL